MTRKRGFHSLAKFLVNHLLVTEPRFTFWSMGSSGSFVTKIALLPLLRGNGSTVCILCTNLERTELKYFRLKHPYQETNWNTLHWKVIADSEKDQQNAGVGSSWINSDVLQSTQENL